NPVNVRSWVFWLAAMVLWASFFVARQSTDWIIGALFAVWAARQSWLVPARQWNRVRIHVEDWMLEVRVGPLPPRTRRSIPVSTISQLFVREQPKSSLTGRDGYQLCAVDRTGAVLPLVDCMTELREARYLEEQLEQHLGIDDAPVAGE